MPATVAIGATRLIITLRKGIVAPPGLVTTYSDEHDRPPSAERDLAFANGTDAHVLDLPARNTHDGWELVEIKSPGLRENRGSGATLTAEDADVDLEEGPSWVRGKARLSRDVPRDV